jgi:peroxiredoxin Q/BCP
MVTTLDIDDPAPDFTLIDDTGRPFTLSSLHGHKTIVLFFYPMDGSPGCTKEAKAFRNLHEELQQAGAEIIGISGDSPERHARFKAEHKLPFRLLSDPGGQVRALYGVKPSMGLIPGRMTFIVGRDGLIKHLYSGQFNIGMHISVARLVLQGENRRATAG